MTFATIPIEAPLSRSKSATKKLIGMFLHRFLHHVLLLTVGILLERAVQGFSGPVHFMLFVRQIGRLGTAASHIGYFMWVSVGALGNKINSGT
eukprot:scaffold1786_cov138-Cylindrotheca_fusiformis.AAC.13